MKIEIGGGGPTKARGDGWVNVDRCATADVRVEFETEWLPFADSTVDEVYSSHCLEHVRNLPHLVAEITRVCKPGAKIELRTPHWGSEMAMCFGHRQTLAEQQATHFQECRDFWHKGLGIWKLQKTEYVKNGYYDEALRLFPQLSENQIFRFVQNTCHEIIFYFQVEK